MAAKCPGGKQLGSQVPISAIMVGLKEASKSTLTTSQPRASNAFPMDLVPQNSSSSLGIFDKARDFRRLEASPCETQSRPNGLIQHSSFREAADADAENQSSAGRKAEERGLPPELAVPAFVVAPLELAAVAPLQRLAPDSLLEPFFVSSLVFFAASNPWRRQGDLFS